MILKKLGTMFPVNKFSNSVMITPNDRILFGYSRIGKELRPIKLYFTNNILFK